MAGRTLLVNVNGKCRRTVYDAKGRVVQEIGSEEYKSELDNLPNAYTDTNAGHRYEYDSVGNLVKEINANSLTTEYTYSSVGTLAKKHFDIYDYYYLPNGCCDKIEVNGSTIIDYDYHVTDYTNPNVEENQFVNRAAYADGHIEEQVVDKYSNVYKKYADGKSYYTLGFSKDKVTYNNNDGGNHTTITKEDNASVLEKRTLITQRYLPLQYCKSVTTDNITTIDEKHFDTKNYQTIIGENKITYKSDNTSIEYAVEKGKNSSVQKISSTDTQIISAEFNYDKELKEYSKSYNTPETAFVLRYDEKGNILSDEGNQYSYDEFGELISTSGQVNASYTYDDRGNMLTKTTNGESISFAYTNEMWQDQLTSVNGNELTYDANGNLTAYGDMQFSWIYGDTLSQITDGENTYSYTYDGDGTRATKTVNGIKTIFNTLNGKIVAQQTGEDILYFQYANGAPIGFVLNDVQYLYITNLKGDIVGITDIDGNLIAKYSYDEWGKLLAITTAEENNAEQQNIAEINPLRYRGYYYDTESGLYYLQSRYYNPDLCRFISADGFSYIDTSEKFSNNAYIYCLNDPILYTDYSGTYPKLSEVPPASSGYKAPKGGAVKEKVPKGSYKGQWGWKDSKGRYWVPDKSDHGGEHWDVVSKDGKSHENIYRDGHKRGDKDDSDNRGGGSSSFNNVIDSIVELLVPSDDLAVVIVSLIPIVIALSVFMVFLPVLLPLLFPALA